jgi:hypothetical protein
VRSNAGRITGLATNAYGKTGTDTTVALVPDETLRQNSMLFRRARPDETGKFTLVISRSPAPASRYRPIGRSTLRLWRLFRSRRLANCLWVATSTTWSAKARLREPGVLLPAALWRCVHALPTPSQLANRRRSHRYSHPPLQSELRSSSTGGQS